MSSSRSSDTIRRLLHVLRLLLLLSLVPGSTPTRVGGRARCVSRFLSSATDCVTVKSFLLSVEIHQ